MAETLHIAGRGALKVIEFLIFAIVAIVIAIRSLRKPEGVLSLSFLAAVFLLGFWGPQFYFLMDSPDLPAGSIRKTTWMATLCLVSVVVGYERGARRVNAKRGIPFRDIDCFWTTCVLVAIGCASLLLLNQLPEHHRNMRSPEGPVVIAAFLSTAFIIAFAFAIMETFRRPSARMTALLVVTSLYVLYRIFIVAKRTVVLEAAIAVLGALWFVQRRTPPRWIGIAAIPAMLILITSVGAYRQTMHEGHGQWASHSVSPRKLSEALQNAVRSIDVERAVMIAGYNETRNAAMNISAKSITGDFDFGMVDITNFARLILPRVIFGDLRDEWFPVADRRPADALRVYYYTPKKGTPPTGIARAYEAFWYFGCLQFFLFAYIAGIFYREACEGHVFAMGMWPHLVFAMVNTISHDTNRCFSAILVMMVLVLPALLFSSIIQKHHRQHVTRGVVHRIHEI